MLKRYKRAQSLLEYSILIAVVAAAVVGMYIYVQRAVNARLKQIQEQVQ